MKNQFKAASMAMASLLAFTACSKEDVNNGMNNGEGAVLDAVTIRLSAPETGRAATTANQEGTEGNFYNTFIYVKTGDDASGSNASYKAYKLDANSTSKVVKYAIEGSKVYVTSNYDAVDGVQAFKDYNGSNTDAQGGPYKDDMGAETFSTKVYGINKNYVGTLSSEKSAFLMSGTANITKVEGEGPITLTVPMNRDLSKVAFRLDKSGNYEKKYDASGTGQTGNTGYFRPYQAGPEGIVIKRGAANVQQFGMNGTAYPWGYALDVMADGYKEDYPTKTGSGSTSFSTWENFSTLMDKVNTTLNDGNSGTTSTDFTFAYAYTDGGEVKNNQFFFKYFYVLPNYTESQGSSTVVVLATKVEHADDSDGSPASDWKLWDPSQGQEVSGSTPESAPIRYYKARISNELEAALTQKNTLYQINAQIYGPGSASIDDAIKEDDTDNLVISIVAQPWQLVISNQVIK